jgi:hypothetical protein
MGVSKQNFIFIKSDTKFNELRKIRKEVGWLSLLELSSTDDVIMNLPERDPEVSTARGHLREHKHEDSHDQETDASPSTEILPVSFPADGSDVS